MAARDQEHMDRTRILLVSPVFWLSALFGFSPTSAAEKLSGPPTSIIDLSHGHVAYLRIPDERATPVRAAELRVVYKDPLAPDGGDVMIFHLDFACPGPPAKVTGDISFRAGELWKRAPPAKIRELSAEDFDPFRGHTTLEKARTCVCETSRFRSQKLVQIKVPRVTHTYFALLELGVHYQVAMALANVSSRNVPTKAVLRSFKIPPDKGDSVISVLKQRDQPTEAEQVAP